MGFLNFPITGDPAFDFFFSIAASMNVFFYLAFAFTSIFRGRV
ncbi:MAG: hypothetical protein ACI8WT_003138 [Clostridium sp.]|jgi:hypothetical protein